MLDFFSWIVDFFETIWSFLTNIVTSFITLLDVIGDAIKLPPMLLGMVPGIIGASLTTVVAIGVAKLIVGR